MNTNLKIENTTIPTLDKNNIINKNILSNQFNDTNINLNNENHIRQIQTITNPQIIKEYNIVTRAGARKREREINEKLNKNKAVLNTCNKQDFCICQYTID